ncbi:MAG: YHS domain-containing protein [Armatimonadetes bacterium]|nr:YHS domain-containing protein [Armatimonadota bacterium]
MVNRTLILLLLALGLAAAAAVAAGTHRHGGGEQKEGKPALVCPVMKSPVSADGSGGKSVFRGRTYYFCCPGCKQPFEKDPHAYVCPVTGDALPKKPAASSTYKGKTYRFCCKECKPLFDKNPAKYLAPKK